MAAEWTDREKRLYDALNHAIDYIGDGSPDEGYASMMAEARAALKDMYVVGVPQVTLHPTAQQVMDLLRTNDPHREVYRARNGEWFITHGGGKVPEKIVRELHNARLIKSVYSNCPADSFHVGETLDVEATRELRKTRGNRHAKVYL